MPSKMVKKLPQIIQRTRVYLRVKLKQNRYGQKRLYFYTPQVKPGITIIAMVNLFDLKWTKITAASFDFVFFDGVFLLVVADRKEESSV